MHRPNLAGLFAIIAIALLLTISGLVTLAQDGEAVVTATPTPTFTLAPTNTPEAANQGGGSTLEGTVTYVVQEGDVLDLIAAGFDVDIDCIIERNNLERPWFIEAGDTLIISDECPFYDGGSEVFSPRPGSPNIDQFGQGGGDAGGGATAREPDPNDELYTVVRGDTLADIAEAFDVSLGALAQANGNPRPIFPGDVLIIPGDAPPYGYPPAPTVPPGAGGGVNAGPGDTVHVVQPGDVVEGIAAAYRVDRACLIDANELETPNRIFPGQEIVIPGNCPPYTGTFPEVTPRPNLFARGQDDGDPNRIIVTATLTPDPSGETTGSDPLGAAADDMADDDADSGGGVVGGAASSAEDTPDTSDEAAEETAAEEAEDADDSQLLVTVTVPAPNETAEP